MKQTGMKQTGMKQTGMKQTGMKQTGMKQTGMKQTVHGSDLPSEQSIAAAIGALSRSLGHFRGRGGGSGA